MRPAKRKGWVLALNRHRFEQGTNSLFSHPKDQEFAITKNMRLLVLLLLDICRSGFLVNLHSCVHWEQYEFSRTVHIMNRGIKQTRETHHSQSLTIWSFLSTILASILVQPCLLAVGTRSKGMATTPGLITRNKNATRSKGIATSLK